MSDAEVGRQVQARRKELGLSQGALGQALGVTHAAISDIERGKTHITLDLLDRLAVVLDTTPAALAWGVGPQEREHVHYWMPAGLFPGTTVGVHVVAPAFVAMMCHCGAVRGVMFGRWEWS